MFVCGWHHGETRGLPGHRVEIIGETAWTAVGRGFDVSATFEALVKELKPGGDPTRREDWKTTHYTDFGDWPSERVRQDLREGKEPVFERFRSDAAFQAELLAKAPSLAARYERWTQAAAIPSAATGSKADTRRL